MMAIEHGKKQRIDTTISEKIAYILKAILISTRIHFSYVYVGSEGWKETWCKSKNSHTLFCLYIMFRKANYKHKKTFSFFVMCVQGTRIKNIYIYVVYLYTQHYHMYNEKIVLYIICNNIVAILLKHFYENKRCDFGAAGICLDYIHKQIHKKWKNKRRRNKKRTGIKWMKKEKMV